MRQPKQKRSTESAAKVIAAAEQILRNHSADELTIGMIVKVSGVSVGSIYARFSDKEGLFQELVLRFMGHTLGEMEQRGGESWKALSLSDAIDDIVVTGAEIYHAHRGVLRALTTRTKLSRDQNIQNSIAEYNRKVCADIRALLLVHADQIEHPDIEQSISIFIEAMTSILRDSVILSDHRSLDVRAVARVQDLLRRFLIPSKCTSAN